LAAPERSGACTYLGWSFIADGQPVVLRGVAIPKGSRNVNAAKLMVDYIISEDGQRAFGRGGLTPARPGIKPGDGIAAPTRRLPKRSANRTFLYRLRPGRPAGLRRLRGALETNLQCLLIPAARSHPG
jgi:hypothetical protein